MALIAGVLLMARPLFYSLTGAKLSEETNALVRVIRTAYNKAIVSGQTLRLVLEIKVDKKTNQETNTYWVEASKEDAPASQATAEEDNSLWANRDKEEEARKAKYLKKPNFAPIKELGFGKPHKFSKDVRLYGLWVEGMKERLREGTTYLYFSPMGYTQRAQISLTDDPQARTIMVISTEPLTGEVSVNNAETPL